MAPIRWPGMKAQIGTAIPSLQEISSTATWATWMVMAMWMLWLVNPADPTGRRELIEIATAKEVRTGGTLADIDGDGDLDAVWGNAWYENPPDHRAPWQMYIIDQNWPSEARAAV